jgi:AraC-like DNA-binding protein
MNYNEIIVSNKPLNGNVLCFWQMTGFIDNESGVALRHIPKGQSLLIFNFGDKIEQLESPNTELLDTSYFIIPAIATSKVFKQKGEINLFGVTFIADGLFNFLQHPISESPIRLPDSLKEKCEELYLNLKTLSFNEKAKETEKFLNNHINQKKKNPTFNHAIKLIEETSGCIIVSELAEKVNVTERQLQRLFKSRLGISPKDYCKVIRVNSYIEFILTKEKSVDWMELVVAFNYHDQPHLVNEIKSITKLSPQKLLRYRDTLYNLYSY